MSVEEAQIEKSKRLVLKNKDNIKKFFKYIKNEMVRTYYSSTGIKNCWGSK